MRRWKFNNARSSCLIAIQLITRGYLLIGRFRAADPETGLIAFAGQTDEIAKRPGVCQLFRINFIIHVEEEFNLKGLEQPNWVSSVSFYFFSYFFSSLFFFLFIYSCYIICRERFTIN